MPATGQRANNGDRPATIATRRECHRLRNTSQMSSSRRSNQIQSQAYNHPGYRQLEPPGATKFRRARSQQPIFGKHLRLET